MRFIHFSPDEQIVNEEEVKPELDQFKEDGDDLLINIGDDEAPEADPEEDTQSEDTVETTETVYEAPKGYEGQDLEAVTKRHQDSSAKITELSQELKNVKEQLGKANLTPQELREQLKATEVKTLLDQEREKLRDMDPDEVSREELRNQQRLVDELGDEYGTKSHSESIRDIVQSGENKSFKVAQKEKLVKDYDLTDEEVKNVDLIAENNYLENGKLTERSYQHAMLSVYGADRMIKATEIQMEQKARTDIMTATDKTQAGVDASSPGVSGNYVNLDKLIGNPAMLDKYIKTHTPEQVEKLQAKIKQLM